MSAEDLPQPVDGVVLSPDGPALVKRGYEAAFVMRNGGCLLYTRASLDAVRAQEQAKAADLQRRLNIAMRQLDSWKARAFELHDKLQKYEPGGAVMLLNRARDQG